MTPEKQYFVLLTDFAPLLGTAMPPGGPLQSLEVVTKTTPKGTLKVDILDIKITIHAAATERNTLRLQYFQVKSLITAADAPTQLNYNYQVDKCNIFFL